MQTGLSTTVDAGALHPIEIHSDDPRHLNNLTARIASMNSQSASDTKYDPKAPPRVDRNGKEVSEAFVAELDVPYTKLYGEFLYATGALSLIIFIMALFTYLDPKMYLSISQNPRGLTLIGLAAFISLISMGISYYGFRTNEVILWYPVLKYPRVAY